MHRLLLRDHYKVVRIPLQHASTALCIDVGPHDHGLSNAGDLCADAKLLEAAPNLLRVRGAFDLFRLRIGDENLHAFINRHIGHHRGNLILLQLREQMLRRNADLNHLRPVFIPDDGIHHLLAFGGIRRHILAHRQLLVRQHRLKIGHLLTRIEIIAKILRDRTAVDHPRLIQEMDLIHRNQLCNPLQLIHIELRLRLRIQNIGHSTRTHDIVRFQRFDQIRLVLIVLFEHRQHTIQHHLGGPVRRSIIHIF